MLNSQTQLSPARVWDKVPHFLHIDKISEMIIESQYVNYNSLYPLKRDDHKCWEEQLQGSQKVD